MGLHQGKDNSIRRQEAVLPTQRGCGGRKNGRDGEHLDFRFRTDSTAVWKRVSCFARPGCCFRRFKTLAPAQPGKALASITMRR